MNTRPLLTVFTCTYNRAHTIGRTYESLCRQTCKDLIWLVVDDGSLAVSFDEMPRVERHSVVGVFRSGVVSGICNRCLLWFQLFITVHVHVVFNRFSL